MLGQAKINENINKKLLANDKTLESINVKLETLSSTLKNQLSFNKMIETQLAQIATSLPAVESGKIPGQLWRNHPKLLGPSALIFVAKQL